jgi:nucleoside-diphosphate-sugar epimerase
VSRTHLIIGCGYLGRVVARLWLAEGERVAALTRSRVDELRSLGIEPIVGDVTEPASLRLPAADTVVYAVGLDRSPNYLKEYLAKQLTDRDLTPKDRELALHIISFIDWTGHLGRRNDKGELLPVSLLEVASTFTPPATEERVGGVLRRVQQLDPPGVGARNLRECLLLQVDDETPHRDLVRRIVLDHLEDVQHNRLPAIHKRTGANLDEIREAIEVIRHLNPKPGSAYPAGRSMREVYVGGLTNVLDALPAPRRFVYVSSTSVYGQGGGEWVDEDSPTEPVEENGRIVLECERLLRRRLPDAIILRLAGIYGPGRLIKRAAVERGEPLATDPDKTVNLIHVEDGARAVVAAAERGRTGATYNVADGRPVTRREFYGELARLLGAPSPRFEPMSVDRTDRRISNRRLRSELGLELLYADYRAGLRQAVERGRS